EWILPNYVRSLVKAHLADGNLKIDELAEIAGMSTRSLQRYLTENCSSFSQIMQESRFETACMHLDNLNMKIKDVAAALGYANSTHFSRYFRRHSGISPRQYRSQKQ
ncbi:MAG: helix-turn-helix transcriptional regulator, partial [Tateyamaria sp.]|nr:helix-turn-helix transcriptional regulator [Tateyamaria sp.]